MRTIVKKSVNPSYVTHCHVKDLYNSKKSCIFRVDEGGSEEAHIAGIAK